MELPESLLKHTSIRLDNEGNWWHDGTLFTHQKLSDLFSKSIRWSHEKNRFVLRIDRDEANFEYDSTPLIAKNICYQPTPAIVLNTGQSAAVIDRSPLYLFTSRTDCLTKCLVDTKTQLVRIPRSVFQSLVPSIDESQSVCIQTISLPILTLESITDMP